MLFFCCVVLFFFQAEDGIRDLVRSRGLGDVYKRQPLGHAVRDNTGFRFPAGMETAATRLKSLGFRTGAFVSAFVLDSRFGLDRGFDVYDDRATGIAAQSPFKVPERPSKLDPFVERLTVWLRREMGRPRKQKRTIKQLYADLVSLGFNGSYGRVAAFARGWRADYRRQQQMSGKGTFVPLSFAPGEAFQFDWSEDWGISDDARTTEELGAEDVHVVAGCGGAGGEDAALFE